MSLKISVEKPKVANISSTLFERIEDEGDSVSGDVYIRHHENNILTNVRNGRTFYITRADEFHKKFVPLQAGTKLSIEVC